MIDEEAENGRRKSNNMMIRVRAVWGPIREVTSFVRRSLVNTGTTRWSSSIGEITLHQAFRDVSGCCEPDG